MALEIERKFLVIGDAWKDHVTDQFQLKQGYLQSTPERTVRIRTAEKEAFLTIKGKTTEFLESNLNMRFPLKKGLNS